MARLPVRSVRYIQRYREIAQVFIRHGFGELVDLLDLQRYLSLPRRLLRRWRRGGSPPPLPPLGAPRRVRLALEELGPTFVKLGQVMSTRPDLLPPSYVAELVKLQDTVPPVEWAPIKARIESELGAGVDELFATLDPIPIAAASLAQVHAATLPDGDHVVVKVQRPDIQKTIETDLEILFDLARLLQARTVLSEVYDLPGIVEEFAVTLRAELDYYREGRNADRFRANFAAESYLYIPQVYWDLTTRHVLVLERIGGIKIDDIEALDAAGYDRSRIAIHAARMIIKEVLEDGFFHADPHPGNFIVMPGEVIGAMDFGMVGHLSQRMRTDLIRLYIVAVQMDEEGIVDQLVAMGVVDGVLDRAGLQRDVTRLLRKYHGMPLGAIRAREVIEEVMPVAFRHHLRLPSDLWLLGKTIAMMEGVGLQLDPDFDVFAVSELHVRRFMWRMASPRTWGTSLLKGAGDWSELLGLIPRIGSQLLIRAERGELEITLKHEGLNQALARIDRLANRLSLSVLLSAFIVGLAWLISNFDPSEQWGLVMIMVVLGFVGASVLALWLIFSIWRSGRGR
ncbi:MAG: AarF/ABC1/UbiB kinase family protein [Chloroflexi bacterium]|nr:AarF/ABC1/UbiB kinase family protein [Chloroflexota bacterium]